MSRKLILTQLIDMIMAYYNSVISFCTILDFTPTFRGNRRNIVIITRYYFITALEYRFKFRATFIAASRFDIIGLELLSAKQVFS